ncbi:MAG: HugZ family protein [Methyloligellaceae bacterium]
MTVPEPVSERPQPADARELMRRGLKAALATSDADSGRPHASLVTVATEPGGAPLFLISTLAQHTQNLLKDARACLLFDGTDGLGDPLEGGRVSVFGRAEGTDDKTARRRFLARHPSAELYVDFSDFAFYRLAIQGAHYVGGFGRIHDLTPEDLLTETAGAETLIAAEDDIVAHMNADHADAIALYATRLLGGPKGDWRFAGCDPEGCDLVQGDRALRLTFPEPAATPDDVRQTLVALVQKARQLPA